MAKPVNFAEVSTEGLESSPFAKTLAGLRAHEARYFKNKYDHDFVVKPAAKSKAILRYVQKVLEKERGLKIKAAPLETSELIVDNIKFSYVFYKDGLAINVMYTLDNPKKRAVGFKLSEGMEIPEELATRFKFARMKSKLAGTIRGSFFVIKGEY